MTDRAASRRGVLKRIGAGVGIVGAGGLAGGRRSDGERGPGSERASRDERGRVGTAPGRTGRHVVGADSPDAARAARERARRVRRVLDFDDVGTVVVGEFTDEAAAALEGREDVRYVRAPVRLSTISGRSRQIRQTVPWGVDRIDADVAHADGVTGEGVHVAVVDSGITAAHPDLRRNLGDGRAFVRCTSGMTVRCTWDPEEDRPRCRPDVRRCRRDWGDDVPGGGHGTHVAGIVAAADNDERVVGVAPGATVHAVKVTNTAGFGNSPDVAAGVKFAVDRGWSVVNMSLGGRRFAPVLADAVEYAVDRGAVVVAAAGNSGPARDTVDFPGRHPDVVAVGATTRGDDLAAFSSRGENVDVAAPGADVCSTVRGGDQSSLSGTSMAAPHVAGVAALLLGDGVPPEDVRDRLVDTAEDAGLPATGQGAGLVDAAAALGLDSGDDGVGSGVCNVPR